MTHGQTQTHPALAKPFAYVRRPDAVDVAVAIVTTQRDFGNREDRKQARMKYLVEQRGIDWFRDEVGRRVPHVALESPREIEFDTVEDLLGWHPQGDGKYLLRRARQHGPHQRQTGRPGLQVSIPQDR